MKFERRKVFRHLVRQRVAALIRTELAEGSASFMQDIWDECADDDEEMCAEDALREVVLLLIGDPKKTTKKLVDAEKGLFSE